MSEIEPSHLKELRHETASVLPEGSHMVSGPLQGRLLSQLSCITRPHRILELGTFTGYSTLCLAEGLRSSSEIVTIEKDSRAAKVAQKYFQQFPQYKIDLRIGSVSDILPTITNSPPFDLVYLDADKKGNWSYLLYLLGNQVTPSLLSAGALIITDNTLWKGLVIQELDKVSQITGERSEGLDKKAKRLDKLTQVVHEFNVNCRAHPFLRTVMLPIRDGLTLSRYEPDLR